MRPEGIGKVIPGLGLAWEKWKSLNSPMAARISLSLVIPTYNEERRLPATLRTLSEWLPQSPFDAEVLVIDDGSRDGTRRVAGEFGDKIPDLHFVEIAHAGYMNAIITGLRQSIRPWRATLEADGPVHPRMFASFAADFPDYDIVMGRRTNLVEGKSLFRRLLSSVMSRLFSIFFKGGIHDPQIGFKLYRGEMLEKVLPLLTLRHDGLKSAEIIVKALAFGYRVKEVPVQYKHDEDSRCVPRGNFSVVIKAALALFELWAKSYVEFKRGDLPLGPVRFGFLLLPFWRLMNFPAFPAARAAAPVSTP